MSETVIRSVRESDFESIAALTNIYIRDTVIHFGETPVTAAELCEEWRRGADRYPYLVATDAAGGFLGFAKAGSWRTRAAYRFTAEVGIYVEAKAQGKGLGRRLYQALIDACRAAGFHALIGGVTLPNEASVRLHEALGFKPVAVFPEVGRKFEQWHDVGFWQRTLA